MGIDWKNPYTCTTDNVILNHYFVLIALTYQNGIIVAHICMHVKQGYTGLQ